jgi:hypothetical protein
MCVIVSTTVTHLQTGTASSRRLLVHHTGAVRAFRVAKNNCARRVHSQAEICLRDVDKRSDFHSGVRRQMGQVVTYRLTFVRNSKTFVECAPA